MKAGLKRRWLGTMALGLLWAGVASPAFAQLDKGDSCNQWPIVNGLRHQLSAADIAAAESMCGIADPIDTSPDAAAAIDSIDRSLRTQLFPAEP